VQFEDVDNNPYLMDFYDDMPRWSFNLQIYFLNSRLKQLLEIQIGTETVIQDRTIYEDANIFAPNLHDMGLMSQRDFDNLLPIFSNAQKHGAAARFVDLFKSFCSNFSRANSKAWPGI